MPKPKPYVVAGDDFATVAQETRTWANTPGTYIAGRAHIDEADLVAGEMERRWGNGRLRLVVGPELREKFDRQRYLFNQAIWHGDLEAVRRESARMVNAWRALDRVATEQGADFLTPEVWEVTLDDGTVAAIARDNSSAHAHIALETQRKAKEGPNRVVAVYTLLEIAKLLSGFPTLVAAQAKFPGAEVVAVRAPTDPLDGIEDSKGGLDDAIPF